MHKCGQHEVSMTIYVGSIPYQRKLPKCLTFYNIGHNDLTFDVHILGAWEHLCTKYEVTVFKHVALRSVCGQTMQMATMTMMHCGQSTIAQVCTFLD